MIPLCRAAHTRYVTFHMPGLSKPKSMASVEESNIDYMHVQKTNIIGERYSYSYSRYCQSIVSPNQEYTPLAS